MSQVMDQLEQESGICRECTIERGYRPILDYVKLCQRHAAMSVQWQSIETAPKMKKVIAGYANPLGKWRTILAKYWLEGELESETDNSGFAPEGWYEETQAYEYLMPVEREPTHWMPLPDPPTSE